MNKFYLRNIIVYKPIKTILLSLLVIVLGIIVIANTTCRDLFAWTKDKISKTNRTYINIGLMVLKQFLFFVSFLKLHVSSLTAKKSTTAGLFFDRKISKFFFLR